MAQQALTQAEATALKSRGLVTADEILYREGDVIIAENVQTKSKRVVNTFGLVTESGKQVLKG